MTDLKDLKDKIAVIGVGNTKYGNFPKIDNYGLFSQPSSRAPTRPGHPDQIIGLSSPAYTGMPADGGDAFVMAPAR